MNKSDIEKILESVKNGSISVENAMETLKEFPVADMGFASLDMHRQLRRGFPEVIFGQGKTNDQILKIIKRLDEAKHNILCTRVNKDVFEFVKNEVEGLEYNPLGRTITKINEKIEQKEGIICIVSAGTSDIPVAEEAVETATIMGNKVEKLYDIGVAGIHRLLNKSESLRKAKVIVVVAGMEGALPSVVSGLVGVPVIAVPTSVGYGASFGGIAALLGMLNSCSTGIGVVNIDNGFGAAYLASLINQ